MSTGSIVIVGCGVSLNDINQKHIDAVYSSDMLAGVSKYIDFFPDYSMEKLLLDDNFCQNVEVLIKEARNKRVAILASGDSLFYGISSMIFRMANDINIEVIPNVSSIQVACSKFLIPWSQAGLYSIHGKDGNIDVYNMLREKYAILLCDNKNTPNKIAKKIVTTFPESSKVKIHIAENLGLENEKLFTGNLIDIVENEFESLSIMIFDNRPTFDLMPSISLGRKDEFYEKVNNCITHSEVRAVVLSKLDIKPGVIWDIGAGSGSVGIEAAGLCIDVSLFSVEKYSERVNNIKKNIDKSFINATVVEGNAPDCLNDLPDPDRVFIGGGGKNIVSIINTAIERLKPKGVIVCTAVLMETALLIEQNFSEIINDLIEVTIKRAKPVGMGTMMSSDNSVKIYTITKDEE